jgi:outer membrane protein W
MITTRAGLKMWAGGTVLVAALVSAAPVAAQRPAAGDGFLFKQPGASARLWLGYARPIANSAIFSFVTDTFTLSKNSFGAFAIGGELDIRGSPRMEVVLGMSYAGSKAQSEYRHWLDNLNLPIRQTTTLERVPLTLSVKWYLRPPGEWAGHFAWVPRKLAPFVGVGGGAMWYRFQQYGDFIDFTDSAVVNDSFDSHDWSFTAHAFAGVDYAVGPRWLLTGQVRYTWARSHLGSDYVGPNRIDLSGLSVTAGLGLRF